MKILYLAITDPIFMESYHKAKNINILFDPVISVMAKHIFETSNIFDIVIIENNNINKTENILSDELENKISEGGVKILEKLLNQQELLKMIKNLKNSIHAFNPAKVQPQHIVQLEYYLLFTFCILKVKNFFNTELSSIIEALNLTFKKEVTYIECFKKEKSGNNNKEDEDLVNDNIKSSTKRILLLIGILKLIFDNCIELYNEVKNSNVDLDKENFLNENLNDKYLNLIKCVLKIYLEFFEKSNDTDNIVNFLENIKKNSLFLLVNEKNLNVNVEPQTNYTRKKSVFIINEKKTDLEDSILYKITNNLIVLMRKNIDYDKISDIICSIFLNFCKKKIEICDMLVKSGCPRLLMGVIENTTDSDLVKRALELLKIIIVSSDENLNMISNQSKNKIF